jgi:hypothetical protein
MTVDVTGSVDPLLTKKEDGEDGQGERNSEMLA